MPTDHLDPLFGQIAAKLREAARKECSIDAAQVRIMGIEALRLRAGAQWPHIRDRIRAKAQLFLERRVSADDIVIPCGEGFLIVFATGDADQCGKRCAELWEELEAFFLGEEAMHGLTPVLEQVELTGENLANFVPRARAPEPPPEAPQAQRPYRAGFLPVWSPLREVIVGYFHSPLHDGERGVCSGYQPVPMHRCTKTELELADLDQRLLDVAAKAARLNPDASPACMVGVSVHSRTLASRTSRQLYLRRLMDVPPDIRRRFVVSICGVEPGVPRIVLTEWIGLVRSIAPNVGVHFEHIVRPPAQLDDLNAWSIGFTLPRHGLKLKPAGVLTLQQQMQLWRGALPRGRTKLCVGGLTQPELFLYAMEIGVDLVTSDFHWPARQRPGLIEKAPVHNLFASPIADRLSA